MNLRENRAVLLALAIPVIMVIAVAVAIYIPRANVVPPQHNFLYVVNLSDPYGAGYYYTVQDGTLQQQKRSQPKSDSQKTAPIASGESTRLFLHNVTSNSSEEINFEEAQKFQLDSKLKSADGYEIQQGSGGGVFPFFSDDSYNNRYLVQGTYSIKLNLPQADRYGYYNFQLLGWVVK